MKKILAVLFLALLPFRSMAGDFDLGGEYWDWTSNLSEFQKGSELWIPMSLSLSGQGGMKFYVQSMFGDGHYQTLNSDDEIVPLNLSGLSDTLVGLKLSLPVAGLPSGFNVGLNWATGNRNWENEQQYSNLPEEYIDTRYRGRGAGFNALWRLALSQKNDGFGLAAGYLSKGAYNPTFDMPMGMDFFIQSSDTALAALDKTFYFKNGYGFSLRAWVFYFLPVVQNGQTVFQYGSNFDLTLHLILSRSFSIEAGGQYYLTDKLTPPLGGSLESENLFGPRAYVVPSLSFGEFSLSGDLKYVFANGIGSEDPYYDDGGFWVGGGPALRLDLDKDTGIRISGTYNRIVIHNGASISPGSYADIIDTLYVVGAHYVVDF